MFFNSNICITLFHIIYSNLDLYNSICISPQIKDLTCWYFDYQSIEDIYLFFIIKFPTNNNKLDLYGHAGSYLRTLSPKDYFAIVNYEKELK